MYPDNPYQPPTTSLEQSAPQREDLWDFTDPKRLPSGRGLFWISEGFRLFARNPGIWIVNMILFFIITMVLAFIPLISIVNYILQPIFLGGLSRGCFELDNDGTYEVNHLFIGFNEKGSKLATLGALQLGIMFLYVIVIVIVVAIFALGSAFLTQDGAWDPDAFFTSLAFIIGMLVVFVSMIFLGMAFWLAPQLVMLHDLDAMNAVKMSFVGSWRNILPMFVFGLAIFGLMLIAIIPFGLGLLVMWPVFIAATYAAWKDIFTNVY